MTRPARDADAVLDAVLARLAADEGAGTLRRVGAERPSVGFSSETWLVDVSRPVFAAGVDASATEAADAGGAGERLVVKLPPADRGIFPTYDFVLQARVQAAVAAAGVPTAVPARAGDGSDAVGVPYLVMPAVAGHIVDEMPVRDHWLTREDPALSERVHGGYLDTLAAIHRVDWRAAGLAGVAPARDDAAELAHWRGYLDWYGDGEVLVPALVDALDWCARHRPAAEPPPALLWGDVRLGNVVFDDDRRPVAVLDWEMTTIGAPEHDLAWALALEGVQAELFGRTVPGFLDHDAAVARYETALGRRVQALDWYEILALVRSTAIMTRVAHLHALAGEPPVLPIADNPILDILARRIAAAGGGS